MLGIILWSLQDIRTARRRSDLIQMNTQTMLATLDDVISEWRRDMLALLNSNATPHRDDEWIESVRSQVNTYRDTIQNDAVSLSLGQLDQHLDEI